MQTVATIVLGVVLAASVFLFAKGIGAVIRQRWREGLAGLVGLGLFATYVILLGVAAYLFVPADLRAIIDPPTRARILAENISSLMNRSALGAPIGLLIGVVFFIRNWRASRSVP